MGRAIITTEASGCRNTVEDGVNGYLVPVGDSELLAERICELVENRELREAMEEESYRICKEKYEISLVNEETNRYMF